MKQLHKILLISLSCFIVSNTTIAQGSSTAFRELIVPVTAQTAGLASSNVTGSSFDAFLLNPANVATAPGMLVLLSVNRWIQETSFYTLGIAVPTKYGTVAFVTWNASVPNIELRIHPGPSEGTFSYHSSYYGILYSYSITSNLSFGVGGKYIANKIYVNESDGYAFDCGAVVSLNTIRLGVSILNAGSLSNREQLPTRVLLGGSYEQTLGEFTPSFFFALSSELSPPHTSHLHIGTEIKYSDLIIGRLGYVTGYDSHALSFGVGFHISFMKVEYSYIPFRYSLENSHCITLQFNVE